MMAEIDQVEEPDEDTIRGWEEYRNAVIENKNKSQDDFEKYINLLATGGILLSLTFLEKIATMVIITYMPLYVVGLILLLVTLLSNLYSHYKSMRDADLIILEIDDKKYIDIFKNIEKRNILINRLNKASIWSLFIGTLSIITFVSINLFAMNENQQPKPSQNPGQNPKPLTEEKGRVTPTPPSQLKPSNNSKK